LFGDKIRSQTKPFLYLFQLVAAKDPVHEAIFGAKVREVVIATNNEPKKITERNGGISRSWFILACNNAVADADKNR
ncbi:hypothetical protein, partial [Aeromonas caviae]|uniref:hypothetical protein n=1 Tax=Aeromonas caviae TaxID=648 RepID=UPI0030146BA1